MEISAKYFYEKEFIVSEIKKAHEAFLLKRPEHIIQKSQFDLVTEVDQNIEKYLVKKIKEKFPADNILAEEGFNDTAIKLRTWTIDPIDGTCNMASGISMYGTQCSLIENEQIVLSVIYLPFLNQALYAIKGAGAYCNEKPIKVNATRGLNNALVSLGDYPHKKGMEAAERQHEAVKNIYDKVAKIRMFGAACVDFTYVAQGLTDGAVLITKNLWDLAPGMLLCEEAGAFVCDLDGKPYKIGAEGVIVADSLELKNLLVESYSTK